MHRLLTVVAAVCFLAPTTSRGAGAEGKKILFVNSYHQGYPWSDGEEAGVQQVLGGSGARLDFYRMDTKRHGDDKWLKDQIGKVKAYIDAEKPDLVIVADDNATKAMVQHFKNVSLPWVFCGVNWDSSGYGLPFRNATGVNEVALTTQLLEAAKPYAKGSRIGFLTVDTETERTEQRAYHKQLKLRFTTEKYVKTLAQWKEEFQRMQGDVDLLLLGNFAGINDWNEADAAAFALAHSRIPSTAMYDFMMPYAMLGMTKIAEEQGILAGKMALAILKGTAPSAIPVTQNKEAKLYLNVKLASRAGIVFKPELVKAAEILK